MISKTMIDKARTMTTEAELRRQIKRGNEYLNVINYAIKVANERGDHLAASWIVAARENAKKKAREL